MARRKKTYQRIVFLQGEEATEVLDLLDEQGENAAIDYLAQWDYGDAVEESDEPASGSSDYVKETRDGFRLSYNPRLSYIGLERVIKE